MVFQMRLKPTLLLSTHVHLDYIMPSYRGIHWMIFIHRNEVDLIQTQTYVIFGTRVLELYLD